MRGMATWCVGVAIVGLACSSATDTTAPPGASATPPSSSEEETPDSGAPSTADGGASAATSSKGSGGLACTSTETLAGSGREVCVVTVGAIELKIVLPEGGSGPLSLGLYLHGDGAGAHKSNSALRTLTSWADAEHGIIVSALAPNGCAWWQTPAHDCQATTTEPDNDAENTAALESAFVALLDAYDVRLDRTFYYGSSGGSIFLTEQWLPLQGHRHPGVFALNCGGKTAKRTWAWDTTDTSLRAKQSLAFTYGDQDFLVPDIEASIADLEKRSFEPTIKVIPGAAHCAFDGHSEALGVWNAAP
jgi:hypothetical protein